MAQSWDIHTACLTAQERNRPPKYASQSALLPPTRRTHTRSHEISPELAKMGPWALGPRLGRAWAHWAHARWSKKIGIFECRGSTASFVPFPKIILSKRAYLCTKAERSHRFHILVNGCPIFVASDGSAVAQGGILRESESLSSASARRTDLSDFFERSTPRNVCWAEECARLYDKFYTCCWLQLVANRCVSPWHISLVLS